jgi:hypothetical protein
MGPTGTAAARESQDLHANEPRVGLQGLAQSVAAPFQTCAHGSEIAAKPLRASIPGSRSRKQRVSNDFRTPLGGDLLSPPPFLVDFNPGTRPRGCFAKLANGARGAAASTYFDSGRGSGMLCACPNLARLIWKSPHRRGRPGSDPPRRANQRLRVDVCCCSTTRPGWR